MRSTLNEFDLGAGADRAAVLFTSDGPVTVISADFDGDGRLDIAVADVSSGRVNVWRGDGKGGFNGAEQWLRPGCRPQNGMIAERLTAREIEVASLLSNGFTDGEIAATLGIGRRTVETHAANIRAKLGLRSRRELIRNRRWPAA